MRTVRMHAPGPPSVLVVDEVEVPRPGAGEVAVDVAYAGTGFVDVMTRRGDFSMPMPMTLGLEATGTVREVGEGVTDLEVGQRVGALLNDFGRRNRAGGYAEVALAHASMTVPLPDGVDLATATGLLVNGVTAWIALRDVARTAVEDTVLVLGASGGLGGTSARLAAALPAREVVAVVSGDPGRAPAAATDVVLTEELGSWLETHDPDVVLDPVGGEARRLVLAGLAPFGRHVVLGNATGDDVLVSSDDQWHATTSVSGLNLGAVAHRSPDLVRRAATGVLGLLARGLLPEPRPVVRPLEDAVAVHEAFEDRTAPAKTVLEVAGG